MKSIRHTTGAGENKYKNKESKRRWDQKKNVQRLRKSKE